jgi:predicted small lipoprotein YifL
MLRVLAMLAAAAILVGCGVKGPLYLPEDKAAGKQPSKPVPTAPGTGSGRPL